MTAPAIIAARGGVEGANRYHTIVIGGSQAGLAVGHHLAKRNIDFVILSGESRIGDNWRRRWNSLRLFTPAGYSGLPGMSFGDAPSHLAGKDHVADYLEQYALRFALPVRLDTRVEYLGQDDGRFVVRAGGVTFEADNVIVATGPFQQPLIPALSKRLDARFYQLHSSEYQSPSVLPDGAVLVVGAGNSGAQIALELSSTRDVWLSGRDTGHLPRRLLGRDLFDWIWPVISRASLDTVVGRWLRSKARRGGDALIGIPERTIADSGIRRVGRLTRDRAGFPEIDGAVLEPRTIVWCTGFRPDFSWIDLPVLGKDGYPTHVRGVVAGAPGLFFVGQRFQHRMSSSLIGGVGADAEFITAQIARRVKA